MIRYENDCAGCDVCHNCGMKRNKHYYCDECGDEIGLNDELIENGYDEHFHEDCWYKKIGFDDSLTLYNAELFGDKETKNVELNGFYAGLFTPAEINEILKKEYLNGRTEEQIKEDVYDMADWDRQKWIQIVI